MKIIKRSLPLLLTTVLLAGCGGDGAGSENAMAEGNGMMMNGSMMDNGMMADPSNPFAQTEMDMNRKMMAAVGSSAGDNWTAKMIEHHQGAVDMSRIVLDQNPSADVAKLARETIEKQSKEIEELRKLRQQGSPDQQSAELYRPAMMSMHQAMMSAKGADVSETYLRKMLEHHKGAVAMSDVALANGVTRELRTKVQKTRSEQQKEAAMIEAMLRGEPMQQAMQATGVKSAAEAKAEAAPAGKAKPAAASEPKSSTAKSKATPPAEPKSETNSSAASCTAEHRAMGHC